MASIGQRVVLLGASNLRWGFRGVVDTACGVLGPPLEVMAAAGLGRSYGERSNVLGRSLSGIVECGLWDALSSASALRTAALVTDIGNDLVYGRDPATIAAWVRICLQRLDATGARVIVTRLPMASIEALGGARYLFFRALYYPRCRLDRATIVERAADLDARLAELAETHGATLFEPRREWYGPDAIHFRRRLRRHVWAEILRRWEPDGKICESDPKGNGAASSSRPFARRLRPRESRVLGLRRTAAQPCITLVDGTTVAMY